MSEQEKEKSSPAQPLPSDAVGRQDLRDVRNQEAPGFTPGPWAWDSRNNSHYLITMANDAPHSIVLGWPNGISLSSDRHGLADASLIASAPDLYAALSELLRDITDYQRINNLGGENNHAQVMARAALQKAEGR
jgi:hypothetical protein